eukprot:TRINITY_DN28401_c0_g1_i6.p1 TRINITY_DN28401_c0_g1~~TRINITY_DN28401_c0_g1_i6.p1  ORF type:complete len:327 (+),score=82.41 TRINITY_DN28401_c0_g1_i6:165-1145(+)
MSATEQMRAMLDAMMGTARNGEATGLQFNDPSVCKSFLLKCCPHDILAATRMDIGECNRVHDLALRADYELAQKKRDHFYDVDAYDHLNSFVSDCDRKTEMSKIKLAETQDKLSDEVTSKANLVHDLAEKIGKKLAAAEAKGAEGEVDESMKLMEEVEEYRKLKVEAEQDYRNSMPASSYQQQKLRVCEVCSAYLGIHDNDRRLADHFGGKLHLGFIEIREKLLELEKDIELRKQLRRAAKLTEYEVKPIPYDDKDRYRDRERDRHNRDRDRDRDRDRRRRSRSRSRDRERRRRRSRSRHRRKKDRRRRSSSGSRDERSRSRHSSE